MNPDAVARTSVGNARTGSSAFARRSSRRQEDRNRLRNDPARPATPYARNEAPQAISGKDDSSSLKLPNRQPERYTLQNRNVVFVVDDDPAMLRSVARLLRQFGYASLLFSSAAPFVNHSNFEEAFCVALDINFGRRRLRHRVAAPSQGDRQISAGHYMTGNDSVSLHTAALQSDCLAYLTKPFSPKSLRESFDSVSVV
jgi:CheY-like chemotaxis protein